MKTTQEQRDEIRKELDKVNLRYPNDCMVPSIDGPLVLALLDDADRAEELEREIHTCESCGEMSDYIGPLCYHCT